MAVIHRNQEASCNKHRAPQGPIFHTITHWGPWCGGVGVRSEYQMKRKKNQHDSSEVTFCSLVVKFIVLLPWGTELYLFVPSVLLRYRGLTSGNTENKEKTPLWLIDMVITCFRETDILFSVKHKSSSSCYGCLSFITNNLQLRYFTDFVL